MKKWEWLPGNKVMGGQAQWSTWEKRLTWELLFNTQAVCTVFNILVPDTTVHLQDSSGVHTRPVLGYFGNKRGANTGGHGVKPYWWEEDFWGDYILGKLHNFGNIGLLNFFKHVLAFFNQSCGCGSPDWSAGHRWWPGTLAEHGFSLASRSVVISTQLESK